MGERSSFPPSLGPRSRAIVRPAILGDIETAVLFAGEGSGLIRDCPPAAETISRMVREAEALISSGLDRLL